MHSQLTQKQRCQMEALVSTGAKQAVIAAILGVRPSTVCRELARNRAKGRRGHCAKGTRKQADGRRRKPARRISEAMCSEVVRLMRERDWSPQMISERLRKERGVKVSHEWICQMLLADQANCGTLHKMLPLRVECSRLYKIFLGMQGHQDAQPLANLRHNENDPWSATVAN